MNAPRTHLITGMQAAMQQALGTPTGAFDFDLLDVVKNLTSKEFARRLLGRWAYACDAHINNAIHSALRDFRTEKEADGTSDWDNYQEFIAYIHGIAPREQAMADMGLDVKSMAEQVQRLYTMRKAIHSAIASIASAGTTYEEPSIIDFFLNPKARKDSIDTVMKREENARFYAMDDDGVIDVDKMNAYTETATRKAKFAKADALEYDRMRGKLSVELFNTLIGSVDGADSEDPFGDLDPEWQFKALTGMQRYIDGVIEQAEQDYKITTVELTSWQIEARGKKDQPGLRPQIKAALAHPVMVAAEFELANRYN